MIIISHADHVTAGFEHENGFVYGIMVSWPFILLFAAFFWLIKRYSTKLKALPWVIAGLSAVVGLYSLVLMIFFLR